MHLLRTTPGGFVDDTAGVVRIDQRPADIVILSSADTTLSLLASVVPKLGGGFPSVRLANVTFLRQPASVDFYIDDVLRHARVVVIDHLGGETYWPYGIEQAIALADRTGQRLAMFSGDLQEDPNLIAKSTVAPELCRLWWRYLREGGPANAEGLLRSIAHHALGVGDEPEPPRPLPAAALYHPAQASPSLDDWRARWRESAPVVAILFYKAHWQAANTAVFDALADALARVGLNPLPIAVTSLKDAMSRAVVDTLCADANVALVLNTTAFAAGAPGAAEPEALAGDAPVLQVILSGGNRDAWLADPHGLNARDIAMHVALPEVDGRIVTRAVSFKGLAYRCPHTEVDVVRYQPDDERIAFVAELSRRWCRLRTLDNAEKRVALVLANYPASEGRIGNGVGLDTPASVLAVLAMLRDEGYRVAELPGDGDALLARITEGVTNDPSTRALRPAFQSYPLDDYLRRFAQLPDAVRRALNERWGPPEADPTLRQRRFAIAGWRAGRVFVGVQPSRSRGGDDYANYHDADLVPPHAYLAFYFWLRDAFGIDAIVHVGKHGNLEWLPGKSVALSDACWPDLILGPMPHLYPFIVNDPGEGSQAKRRAQAVIVDHLMPPLTRAENYGPLQDLERQVDEYYDALMVDARRAKVLRETILATIVEHRLHEELSIARPDGRDAEDALLTRVDAWLCELKEAQIRDGLHTFGSSPRGRQRRDTLVALARFPAGDGRGGHAGLIGALARDLALGDDFDPLASDWAAPWTGPRPDALRAVSGEPWRHAGDTRERLELLAGRLIERVCGEGGDADAHGDEASLSAHDARDGGEFAADAHGANGALASEASRRVPDVNGAASAEALRDAPAPAHGRASQSGTAAGAMRRDIRAAGRPPADRASFDGTALDPAARRLTTVDGEVAASVEPQAGPRQSTRAARGESTAGAAPASGATREAETPDAATRPDASTSVDLARAAAHWPHAHAVLERIARDVLPRLDACGDEELRQLRRGLEGRFVPPGPSGSPSRGRPDVLPTGRNFYSVDTRAVPTQAAWTIGLKSAQQLIERHLQEHGDYPRAVGLSVWGTATMRTGGDDIAQALALLGVRPKWAPGSHRVTDFEILPIEIFDRPRIDVTLRVSGFFRDAFANVMHLFDAAVQAVAELDEPEHLNPVRARVRREADALAARGVPADEARRRAGWRVFGARPGGYGAGLQALIDGRHWQTDADLAHVYRTWGGYAYAQNSAGEAAHDAFGARLATIDAVVQNQDNREHDILDSNDYYQFHGGMAAAVRHASGRQPSLYHGDHSNPAAPRMNTLREEIARVIRSRVVNPKWIDGVKRHGYKGAAEIAATVDYLYGYDATARVIADHQYALVTDAYLHDPDTRAFLERHNPHALHGICERLVEAMQRGLWREPGAHRDAIEGYLLESEQHLEGARR
ncbi:cobaltochelatase subunit CobN [Burkholderia oklahomensis]|uniref:cobaltochelatase subunit CobN n=4 Tax=Burkholderia oklahomensis TaxID=342113 RepID=UPI0005D793FB|nr:cobaltochelatase subunit CobN [Burkholderia oklahomensis]AJX31935.1 cobaltochelatase, CobN subunit [Burkholderia oklahomensis C6786]MBI0361432.1 cobaltochelatase subunit CobN [Burkholderia oklahomensis]SUW55397.1 Aerobic cobaltochelatase subunit CobN [Burkholderia oklahomensis]